MDNVRLGQRVYVDKVYAWPDKDTWEDCAMVEFAPIDNPLKDDVAIVVGMERKKYRSEIQYYICGDGGPFTGGSEGYFHNNLPSKRTFVAVRYTLRGRRHFTTLEHMRAAE